VEEENKNADNSGEGIEAFDDGKEADCKPVKHKKKHGIDPFNNEETDTAKSNAMRKSCLALWKICYFF
jgi:hypothetical protein